MYHSSRLPSQFVADGVFYAELNELLTRELSEDGYSGVEVRVTPMRTEIIIKATRTQNVLGKRLEGGEWLPGMLQQAVEHLRTEPPCGKATFDRVSA